MSYGYMTKFDLAILQYESQIAYLKAVCRIAADKLENGGTFPIKGETWDLLDFAAGKKKPEVQRGAVPDGCSPAPSKNTTATEKP